MSKKAIMNPSKQIERKMQISNINEAVHSVCDQILCELKESGYDEEQLFAIHLSLEEVFLNALEHGNDNDPSKSIVVEYRLDSEKFEIYVSDEGEGFKYENVPDPRKEENLLKTSGRGLLLIRSYMDLVEYNESGNRVHMIKYSNIRPKPMAELS